MAICDFCEQEMLDEKTKSCSILPLLIDGHNYDPIKHTDTRRCRDCFISQGGVHHHGCSKERCPKCFGQYISCGCNT